MFAIIVFCDIKYRAGITNALARAENRIQVTSNTIYIADAFNMLGTHIALLCVSAGLIVLMPIYGKLLKKINTEKGTAIVMVTHNRSIVENYPGRVFETKDETCREI